MQKSILTALCLIITLCGICSAEEVSFSHLGQSFKLINPSSKNGPKKPLLLLLHGCKQNAEMIAKGTGLWDEAMKRQFFLLVPEQSLNANSDHCWNWFYSFQQMRGGYTEMSTFISAIENLSRNYPIDRSQLYVAGISAGGAMAHNLLACYPDYFAGVAIHSGLAYKTAENVFEAQTVTTASTQKTPEYLGTKAFECGHFTGRASALKKVLVIHGIDDKRVPSLHADLITSTNEVISDLLDDGTLNHSDSPVAVETVQNYENDYKAFITDKQYKNFTERKVMIKGLVHAWGGGKPISENFDPKAPSSSDFILNFFNL
jgi:poly(hydroxyalkanoate) depolymerase family esterase